jgi:hypothetical protein
MKKILLVVLAMTLAAAGTAMAGECGGCTTKVFGYMAPNFKMIDKGEDNAANLGFGFYYNRFVFSGKMDCGEIVKKLAFRVETDIAQTSTHSLQWVYVQPYFSDQFSLRVGRMKEPFSREILHSTARLITTSRHNAAWTAKGFASMGYGGFTYGMEAHVAQEKFKLQAGIYDGFGKMKGVSSQDPGIDFGARATFMPTKGLEVSGNAMMIALPQGGSDMGTYTDTSANEYLSNTGLGFGFDAEYKKEMGEGSLWLEAEFNMGDNPGAIDDPGDDWSESTFFKWQYYYVRALYMINKQFGLHAGYSFYDPNTDGDAENDSETLLTPGVTYVWCKNIWSKAEIQIHSFEHEDIDSLTHFVLQWILIW